MDDNVKHKRDQSLIVKNMRLLTNKMSLIYLKYLCVNIDLKNVIFPCNNMSILMLILVFIIIRTRTWSNEINKLLITCHGIYSPSLLPKLT